MTVFSGTCKYVQFKTVHSLSVSVHERKESEENAKHAGGGEWG